MDAEDVLQERAESGDLLLDADGVVADVAEVAAVLVVDSGSVDERAEDLSSGAVARWNSMTSRVSS